MIGRAGARSFWGRLPANESGKPPQIRLAVRGLIALTHSDSMRFDDDQCTGEIRQIRSRSKRFDKRVDRTRPNCSRTEEHNPWMLAWGEPPYICEVRIEGEDHAPLGLGCGSDCGICLRKQALVGNCFNVVSSVHQCRFGMARKVLIGFDPHPAVFHVCSRAISPAYARAARMSSSVNCG